MRKVNKQRRQRQSDPVLQETARQTHFCQHKHKRNTIHFHCCFLFLADAESLCFARVYFRLLASLWLQGVRCDSIAKRESTTT